MTQINANWKYPYSAYDIAKILYEDNTKNYEEFARMLRENFVSLEDRIALIEDKIDVLWAAVFP